MTPAQKLAQFVGRLRFEDLDERVIVAARRHLFDTVGVALRGAQQEMPARGRAGLAALPGAQGRIRVWGTDMTLTAPYAALANGIAAHVLDFDDTHTAGIVHGSAILAPTVFAMADEHNATGRELITAFVAGWEVAARVGLAAKGTMHHRGYHTSSTAGVFGAAAAAGKLLNLDERQLMHAMALSGSQASGINEYQSDGTSSKILHTGWAAHAGIVAAYLARAGMTGPATVFEGRLGFLNAYGDLQKSDITQLTDGLGLRWESTQVSIKPYPCCHFAHAFIDCATRISEQGVQADQINRIECVVPELEVAMVCEPRELKRRPTSAYGAKFSLPFMVASALLEGKARHATFSEANIQRDDILDLAAKVEYRVAMPDETTFPDYFPGWLIVHLKDGQRREERMDQNLGTPSNPLSQGDLESKFMDNVAGIQIDASAVMSAFSALEDARVHEIQDLLGTAPALAQQPA
jgi:2-methylcitrate dehydratase PrpD